MGLAPEVRFSCRNAGIVLFASVADWKTRPIANEIDSIGPHRNPNEIQGLPINPSTQKGLEIPLATPWQYVIAVSPNLA